MSYAHVDLARNTNNAMALSSPLLITRPKAEARKLAKALETMDITPVIEPLIHIRPLAIVDKDDGAQAVIVTSGNAIASLAIKPKKLLVVGEETAERARHFDAICAGQNIGELVAYVMQNLRPEDGPILYVSGEEVTKDLVALLPAFKVKQQIVYCAELVDDFTSETVAQLRSGYVKAVSLFSTRTAKHFLQLCKRHRVDLKSFTLFCLSQKIANVFPKNAKIRVSPAPTTKALLSIIK